MSMYYLTKRSIACEGDGMHWKEYGSVALQWPFSGPSVVAQRIAWFHQLQIHSHSPNSLYTILLLVCEQQTWYN